MQFKANFLIRENPMNFCYSDSFYLTGSCFSDSIGKRLSDCGLHVTYNPQGIVFNPISLAAQLSQLLQTDNTEYNIFQRENIWFSWLHHGEIYAKTGEDLLLKLQTVTSKARASLLQSDVLILTWGSAWVYYLSENNAAVANCHKMPASIFTKKLVSVEDILFVYEPLLDLLYQAMPSLKIMFTISPVKYIKDGLHENLLSKSTLFLALHELRKKYRALSYFPSYEIQTEELRDYRFYAEDLAHPSAQAADYIATRFIEHHFTPESKEFIREYSKVLSRLNHKLLHPDTDESVKFIENTYQFIESFIKTYPHCKEALQDLFNQRFGRL